MFKSGSMTIMVSDLNKAKQFYVDILELKVQFEIEGHLLQVEAPGLTIGLLHPREGQGPVPEKSGNISIGFEVENLDSTIELLKSRGVEFHGINDEEATRLANFNDPEGNPLYLIEVKN